MIQNGIFKYFLYHNCIRIMWIYTFLSTNTLLIDKWLPEIIRNMITNTVVKYVSPCLISTYRRTHTHTHTHTHYFIKSSIFNLPIYCWFVFHQILFLPTFPLIQYSLISDILSQYIKKKLTHNCFSIVLIEKKLKQLRIKYCNTFNDDIMP